MKKLQYLKSKIKEWKRDVVDSLVVARAGVVKEIAWWDAVEEERSLTQEERVARGAATSKLWDMDRMAKVC